MKKLNLTWIMIFLSISVSLSCSQEEAEYLFINGKIKTGSSHKITTPVPDPLNHALRLINLRNSTLMRPLSHEEGYMISFRVPVIDHVAESPFYLHHWADETSIKIQRDARKGMTELLSRSIMTMNGGVSYKNRLKAGLQFSGGLEDAYKYLCTKNGKDPDEKTVNHIQSVPFSHEFETQLGMLIKKLTEASGLLKQSLSALDRGELNYLIEKPERYFYPSGTQFVFLTSPTHVQTKIADITRKIDFVKLLTSAMITAEAIDGFSRYVKRKENFEDTSPYFLDGKKHYGVLLDLPTPIGDVVILGQDSDTFSRPCALLIDMGGNDRYTGSIAVGHLVPGRVSVAIDMDGNDIYDNQKNPFSQGFGCLAVGVLADLNGNDRYITGDMSQGTGIFGVGQLMDLRGKDKYRCGLMGQGFGLFGIGTLLDANGADLYTATGMAQGVGSTMGMGLLCDITGNDKYLADRKRTRGPLVPDDWSHAQGVGLSIRAPNWKKNFSYYGGIGFLSEGDGNDRYWASDSGCMGSSYFMSIGTLVDHGGNDSYMPQDESALGFAVHLSNAILIDRKGNDYYSANFSGGLASDRSVALLADYQGNDIYGPSEQSARKRILEKHAKLKIPISENELTIQTATIMSGLSWGAALKRKSIGFLIDYTGNDQYFGRQDGTRESCGGVLPPHKPDRWGHSLLLDLGGRDFYYQKGRKDNHYHLSYHHGVCYDIEYEGKTVPGKLPLPKTDRNIEDKALTGLALKSSQTEIQNLSSSDLFIRFSAVGRLIQQWPESADDILNFLTVSTSTEVNRDLIEVINTAILTKKMHQHEKFVNLISARDPFIQRYAVRTLGWWKIKTALPDLIQSLTKKNESLHMDTIWAIGQFGSQEALNVMKADFRNHSRIECRRNIIKALSSGRFDAIPDKTEIKNILYEGLNDPDEVIRTYAAEGIIRVDTSRAAIDRLSKLMLADGSIYVKRAAANSVILLGEKGAIPVLIETLQYRSIDTYDFYDHDLAKDLSFYCGIDFPEKLRHEHSTWKNWWQNNGQNVNLKKNLGIMRTIRKAFKVTDENTGIDLFERLILKYPDNIVIRNRYKRFLHEWIFFRLITREDVTDSVLERCIRLQKKVIEIGPKTEKQWEQLSSFYLRLSRLEEAISAIQSAIHIKPHDRNLKNVLKQLKSLKKGTK